MAREKYNAAPTAAELVKNNMHQIQWRDGGDNSSVGIQLRKEYYKKGALIEAMKEQYFQPLADVTAMPKHYGDKIKMYQFIPLLDDRNINDQGIDAAGVYAQKTGDTSTNPDGNLYGGAKDIGLINDRLPLLSETGGRVNRVGYTRKVIEGTFDDMGFFHEITKECMMFDTMDDLYQHMSREMVRGASQMTEDVLQMDLINGAGYIRYSGTATSKVTMTATAVGKGDVITYADLQRMAIDLDNADCPKSTKMLTGSRMTDTVVTVPSRIMYIGSEMIPTFAKMTDYFGNPAFVGVEHYAYAGDYKRGTGDIFGEIGKVGAFRLVVVPKMLHEQGVGAELTGTTHYGYRYGKKRNGANNFDAAKNAWNLYPCLVVGSGSFTTIGFQTGGATHKFEIITKMPSAETATSQHDPYGRTGFMSIQWYYGTMILRPERLAVQWSLAEL